MRPVARGGGLRVQHRRISGSQKVRQLPKKALKRRSFWAAGGAGRGEDAGSY